MQPLSLKKGYVSLVEQACAGVPGFRDSYGQFHQKAVIEQNSSSFVENYGRNAATLALHSGKCQQTKVARCTVWHGHNSGNQAKTHMAGSVQAKT